MSVLLVSAFTLSAAALGYVVMQPKSEEKSMAFGTAVKEFKLPIWISQHQSSVKAWIGFLMALIVVLGVLSDGDFSFLLTLSSMIGLMSFLMVSYKIEKSKSVAGVSGSMMVMYILVLMSRLVSIVFWEGYLPWDSTGDWVYQVFEAGSLILCCLVVFNVYSRMSNTYNKSCDTLSPLYIVPPCLLVAAFWHPNLNKSFIGDASWAFALYLEAFAGLPQLVFFHKEEKVQAFTSHFLAAQCLSKICSFVFWFKTAAELNQGTASLHEYWVIVIQAVQLLIMADFIYQYIRCVSTGEPVQFLLNERV